MIVNMMKKKHFHRADQTQHSPHIREPHSTKITNPGQTIRPLLPAEIESYVTFSHSPSWAANVTFIIDKTGFFNCNVCVLTARSRQVRNCPRTQRVVCLALTPVEVLVAEPLMYGLRVRRCLSQVRDIQVGHFTITGVFRPE